MNMSSHELHDSTTRHISAALDFGGFRVKTNFGHVCPGSVHELPAHFTYITPSGIT